MFYYPVYVSYLINIANFLQCLIHGYIKAIFFLATLEYRKFEKYKKYIFSLDLLQQRHDFFGRGAEGFNLDLISFTRYKIHYFLPHLNTVVRITCRAFDPSG